MPLPLSERRLLKGLEVDVLFVLIPLPVGHTVMETVTPFTPRRITIPADDGETISCLLARPQAEEPRPCVLFIHGGGWSSCSADYYLRHMQRITERGAVAASAEYRLKTDHNTLDVCIGDCAAIVRYLRRHAEELGILPHKLCVVGESAGGHLALCLASPRILPDEAVRPDLVVNLNGVVDMTGVFRDRFFSAEELADCSDADAWLNRYRVEEAYSPLYRVGKGNSPALHIQGLRDPVVKPEETLRYHQALQEAGVPSELILLPDQSHAFILFDYDNPDETVCRILEMMCDKLADYEYLQ